MPNRSFLIAAALAALALTGGARAGLAADIAEGDTLEGRAVALDGDTLLMDDRVRVRLHGIDAAEMDVWPWGPRARAVIDDLLGTVGLVGCIVTDVDRHKRPVGVCRTEAGVDLATAVVRAGLAVTYRTYVYEGRTIPVMPDALDDAEAEAREAKRGVWAER